ncbi:MAG: tetratricopeptide repeat protein [Bacteriovoracia bacterium]
MDSSSLIYTYLKRYQENPQSRVFAPLAEAYRKAGLADEAIEIAREGLQVHPNFIGGKVALSRALFDKQMYQEVILELTPVVQDVPDNIAAQRLLAESHLMLGQVADALNHYKMLLYFMPDDTEVTRMVWELEAQAYEGGALVVKREPAREAASEAAVVYGLSEAEEVGKASSPSGARQAWMKKIEFLQALLLKLERRRPAASSR